MTMYAGDELYDDDVTSGPATDDGLPVTIIAADYTGPGRLTRDDRLVKTCWRHYIRLTDGECPDCVAELEADLA